MLALAALLAMAACALPAGAAAAAGSSATATGGKANFRGYQEPLCQSRASLCADAYDNPEGEYVGHDEPSVEFKSARARLGQRHHLPDDAADRAERVPRRRAGRGATWNFQLRPTFWFGLTLCDTESAPEFTKVCKPDSDANDLVGHQPERAATTSASIPATPTWSCSSTGPGYVPQFEGFGCTAHQYCAAMTIDSRTLDQNTGVENTDAPATTTSSAGPSRSTGPTSRRSGTLPGAGQPAVHRHLRQPELQRGQPRHDQGPADEPGRPDPDPHARHRRPGSGSTSTT